MDRFTICHHTGSKEGDHFDLMLQRGKTLKTWRFKRTTFRTVQSAWQIKDHRMNYLDFESNVSGGRGHVKSWDTGTYLVDEWTDDRIRVALTGANLRLRFRLDLVASKRKEKEPRWTLADAAAGVRKRTAALLRGDSLDDAPTPELDLLRDELSREEKRVMTLVEQYATARQMDWKLAGEKPDIRRRIQKEKTRWQHPWLTAARDYAVKLEELAGFIREARPDGNSGA